MPDLSKLSKEQLIERKRLLERKAEILSKTKVAKKEELTKEFEEKKEKLLSEDSFARNILTVEEKISDRGNLVKDAINNLKSDSVPRKIIGTLQGASIPFQSLESGVANAMLSFQKGDNFNQIIDKSGKGFALERQGEMGDLFRRIGASEPVSATMGLAMVIGGPAKVLSGISKGFKSFARRSDKGILEAGNSLVKATDQAIKFSGNELQKMFEPIKTSLADPSKIKAAISELPPVFIRELKREIGDIDNFLKFSNIERLRKIKSFVGSFRPSVFGKADKGALDQINDRRINKAYSMLKNLLNDTVTQTVGKKKGAAIMKSEDAFSEIMRSSNFIRRTVVDPTTRQATRGGSAAAKLAKEGDATFRQSIQKVSKTGKAARKEINRAVDQLEAFNRAQAAFKFLANATNASIIGGIAGTVGSRILQSVVDRD